MNTERRPIPGHAPYEVDALGTVYGQQKRPLRPSPNRPNGYLAVPMTVDNRQIRRYIHHMVLLAFVGPRPDGMEIRHLNGNCQDNRLVNLRYGTHTENAEDQRRHGTQASPRNECPRGHDMSGSNVIHGRKPNGKPRRQCRQCYNDRRREHTTTATSTRGECA